MTNNAPDSEKAHEPAPPSSRQVVLGFSLFVFIGLAVIALTSYLDDRPDQDAVNARGESQEPVSYTKPERLSTGLQREYPAHSHELTGDIQLLDNNRHLHEGVFTVRWQVMDASRYRIAEGGDKRHAERRLDAYVRSRLRDFMARDQLSASKFSSRSPVKASLLEEINPQLEALGIAVLQLELQLGP